MAVLVPASEAIEAAAVAPVQALTGDSIGNGDGTGRSSTVVSFDCGSSNGGCSTSSLCGCCWQCGGESSTDGCGFDETRLRQQRQWLQCTAVTVAPVQALSGDAVGSSDTGGGGSTDLLWWR